MEKFCFANPLLAAGYFLIFARMISDKLSIFSRYYNALFYYLPISAMLRADSLTIARLIVTQHPSFPTSEPSTLNPQAGNGIGDALARAVTAGQSIAISPAKLGDRAYAAIKDVCLALGLPVPKNSLVSLRHATSQMASRYESGDPYSDALRVRTKQENGEMGGRPRQGEDAGVHELVARLAPAIRFVGLVPGKKMGWGCATSLALKILRQSGDPAVERIFTEPGARKRLLVNAKKAAQRQAEKPAPPLSEVMFWKSSENLHGLEIAASHCDYLLALPLH